MKNLFLFSLALLSLSSFAQSISVQTQCAGTCTTKVTLNNVERTFTDVQSVSWIGGYQYLLLKTSEGDRFVLWPDGARIDATELAKECPSCAAEYRTPGVDSRIKDACNWAFFDNADKARCEKAAIGVADLDRMAAGIKACSWAFMNPTPKFICVETYVKNPSFDISRIQTCANSNFGESERLQCLK